MISLSKDTSPLSVPPPSIIFANCAKSALLLIAILLLSLPALLSLSSLTTVTLFYGLPDTSLHRLQLVQNALARVVVPTVPRSHHFSPTLRSLHWLPIPQRITFKIASITFKDRKSVV